MSALYRNKHKKTYKAVKQDDLSRRILAACLSVSFVSQPLTALAGSITASNGNVYVADKDGVFNIYARSTTARTMPSTSSRNSSWMPAKSPICISIWKTKVGKPRTC